MSLPPCCWALHCGVAANRNKRWLCRASRGAMTAAARPCAHPTCRGQRHVPAGAAKRFTNAQAPDKPSQAKPSQAKPRLLLLLLAGVERLASGATCALNSGAAWRLSRPSCYDRVLLFSQVSASNLALALVELAQIAIYFVAVRTFSRSDDPVSPWQRAGLLMPQRLDRVHAGRAPGRKISEQHADAGRKKEGDKVDGRIEQVGHLHQFGQPE